MKTYPNQKVITINKSKADRENTYATINKECLIKAITELTHNELKIYLYLASNQNGFKMALSSADIASNLNIHVRNVQTAINSLTDKQYIKQQQGNQYIFYDTPMQADDDVHKTLVGECNASKTLVGECNASKTLVGECNASKTLVGECNASKTLVGECINHSQDVHKTLVGDAQNTRSNASETLVEILHYNTLYNTSSIIQAAEETEEKEIETEAEEQREGTKGTNLSVSVSDSVSEDIALEKETEEENPKKEDTFINFLKQLNCTQLQEIKDMYASGTPYKEIASTYNIKYFDAAKFADNYETIYKERYDMEHPEQLERRQQQAQAWRERERAEREEDAEIADAINHIKINNRKPVQCDNKPAQSTANKMTMIDGSAIDSRLAGIPFPEAMLDNIKNGIITVDELVEMQLGDMAYNSSADNAVFG